MKIPRSIEKICENFLEVNEPISREEYLKYALDVFNCTLAELYGREVIDKLKQRQEMYY